jgi:ElaB/YqjD/DUF883 family membrane-anchored ribosome-binding protein
MEYEKDTETNKQQMEGESGSAGASGQSTMDRGAEIYGKAEQAVSDVYDKTAKTASETYEKTKKYCSENPGKTILVSLGVGGGLGYLLAARSRPSRTNRIASSVVNALSAISRELFRLPRSVTGKGLQ